MPTPVLPPPTSLDPCSAPDEYCSNAYRAIGEFIISFGRAEVDLSATVNSYLQRRLFKARYSREGMQVLAALSGGMRMEKLRTLPEELCRRLDSHPDDIDLVHSASQKIKSLAEFRNRVGHYGAHPMGKAGIWIIQTSNKYNVRDYDKREMWRYPIEALEAASSDCLLATFRIAHALFPEDRETLHRLATNYEPLRPFKFNDSMIEREAMP